MVIVNHYALLVLNLKVSYVSKSQDKYKLGKQSFIPFNVIEIGCLTVVCGETYWGWEIDRTTDAEAWVWNCKVQLGGRKPLLGGCKPLLGHATSIYAACCIYISSVLHL